MNRIFLSGMTIKRIYISAVPMILAILAIGFFQGYWLFKTYGEEKQTLNIHTNVLFREAVFESQAARFSMDTTGRIKVSNRVEAIRVLDKVNNRLLDSSGRRNEKVIFRFENPRDRVRRRSTYIEGQPGRSGDSSGNPEPESLPFPGDGRDSIVRVNLESIPRKQLGLSHKSDLFYEVLQDVDYFKDSLTVPEVGNRLKSSLQKENIDILFDITKDSLISKKNYSRENQGPNNEVLIGFKNPVRFSLNLLNANSYLLKKMKAQIIVSFLLVALTITSFVVLFRNLIRQRKLTELKNDFISNITHELKTPIATVSVAVEALKSFNALDDPKRTQEYLSISANELQGLSLLVDKVLKLSMFEKKEIELKVELFDLKQLIEEVVGSMRLQFEKYGAIIKMILPDSPVAITADRLHITSVFYNLLDNALKYSNGKPVIEIAINDLKDTLEFSVEDNGKGIPNEYKDKIFDKFFRVPTGDQHNVKGYGLGLSYVAYVIERHKGNITLRTEPGSGSAFIVSLPK
ncbi:MAG TPA: HAMP domain-containing sensor histidine kinase [Flavitalea sp.]|nr:HAMP domain-containing sensor histidine kinase [Flavitalea sp.]